MRHLRLLVLLLVAGLVYGPVFAAGPLPTVNPDAVGLSKDRLDRIHTMVKSHIDAGEISGAVMLVARKGQIAYIDVQGV